MHGIAQNCVCDAQNHKRLGLRPDTAEKLTTLPQSAGEGVNSMRRYLLLNAFSVSLRHLWRLKSDVPLQNSFLISGSALDMVVLNKPNKDLLNVKSKL